MKFFLLFLFTSSILYPQTEYQADHRDSIYKFRLPPMAITDESLSGIQTTYFKKDTNQVSLRGSVLSADRDGYESSYQVMYIKYLVIQNGNQSLKAATFNGIAGSVIGLLTGLIFVNSIQFEDNAKTIAYFTLTGGLSGGLLGFIIGSFVPNYDHYDEFSKDPYIIREQFKRILKKYDKSGK
ncbi:MAG TPA: hypothetical protein PKE39_11030 [Ignavibacteria bacterium]|nr:hypothetical protein [Ignavibacteria bacterium]HMQ99545.1 hypothetical protein [Ignavibacteria bacterium]